MDELRGRIARVLYPDDWTPPTDKRGDSDPDGSESEKRWVAAGAHILADAVLAEIEVAEYVLVARDRAERVRKLAERGYQMAMDPLDFDFHELIVLVEAIQPGDLEPLS